MLMAQPKQPITSFGLVRKVSMKSGNGSDWLMLDTSKYRDFSCVGSSLQIKAFPSFLKNSQNIVIAATLLSCKTNLSLGKNFGHKKVARICASCLSISIFTSPCLITAASDDDNEICRDSKILNRRINLHKSSLERNILKSKMKCERVRV